MIPVLIVKPRLFAWRRTLRDAVVAGLHPHRLLQALDRLHVVVEDVGPRGEHGVHVLQLPLEIGHEHLDRGVGLRWRMARTVAAQTEAPPSASSSRATLVRTQWRRFIAATASATRAGSPRSSSVGRPVWIAQKLQERVQMLPRIMTVAVPRDQHSPRFGHCALWQTV